MRMYPLFICCKHGELSYDSFGTPEHCGHTVGFNSTKIIPKEAKDTAKVLQERFQHMKHREMK